jgi:hypothetical protein
MDWNSSQSYEIDFCKTFFEQKSTTILLTTFTFIFFILRNDTKVSHLPINKNLLVQNKIQLRYKDQNYNEIGK